MSKRKIDQDQLRKLMAKASGAKPASTNKRYKVSARELALIEEQKRQEEKEKAKARQLKEQKRASMVPVPSPDVKPAKSILKKSTSQTPFQVQIPTLQPIVKAESKPLEATPISELPGKSGDENTAEQEQQEEPSESALPEGFFDDPVADAKARKVVYVDHEEEEWEKFQKEIGDEVNAAQSVLVEDRIEATVDRQIEEIDEQIEAWSRVAKLEKQKDVVERLKKEVKSEDIKEEDDSDDDGADVEEFLDWRNKC